MASASMAEMRFSASVQGSEVSSQLPGRKRLNVDIDSLWRGGERDQPMLQRQGRPVRAVKTGQVQQTPAGGQFGFVVVPGVSLHPIQQRIAVCLTARLDLGLQVGNGQDGGVGLGLSDEGAGATAARHQPPAPPVRKSPWRPSCASSRRFRSTHARTESGRRATDRRTGCGAPGRRRCVGAASCRRLAQNSQQGLAIARLNRVAGHMATVRHHLASGPARPSGSRRIAARRRSSCPEPHRLCARRRRSRPHPATRCRPRRPRPGPPPCRPPAPRPARARS